MYSKLNREIVESRIAAAQSEVLDLNDICSDQICRTIQAHASAIGCPNEFLLYPLLSVAAGCMGVRSSIKVHDGWTEPSILWLVVAARKGKIHDLLSA